MEENTLPNLCRACLTEEGQFQSVFVADEGSGLHIHLAEMIMAYASVQITLGDGLPEQICQSCAKKAVSMYQFKQRCEESDAALRQQLGKSPLSKTYSLVEEQRLAVESLQNIDPYTIDVIIKPEIGMDNEDLSTNNHIDCSETENDFGDSFEQVGSHGLDDNDLLLIKEKIDVFVCDVCHKTFSRVSHLNRHKKVHDDQKQFSCSVCNKAFSRHDVLLRHRVMHDEVKNEEHSPFEDVSGEEVINENLIHVKAEEIVEDMKCIPCEKTFIKKEDFSYNSGSQEIKTKQLGLKCPECLKRFTKVAHLTRHLKIHAAVKPHVCRSCNKGFARSEQLVNHMNMHSGIKPHVCNICNKGFNQVSNLKDHMRTHNGEKPFLCSICGKGFNQLGNLRQHTIRHSGIKAHLCSTCGNGFASKGELCAHLRKHTGARPFVCQICNHGFTTSSSLTKHKRIHSGEKPYECEVCKMKFSRSGILARHKRTHTGEKPYVCKFCTKAFSQSNDLSSHLRIHTGEKPYICDTCGQAFRQSSALKTHKKTHMERATLLEIERTGTLVPMIHSTFLNAALP